MRHHLDTETPRKLKRPVSVDHELSSIAIKMESRLSIIGLKEYPNIGAVVGICGSRNSLAKSVGTTKDGLIFKIAAALGAQRKLKISDDAPFLANRVKTPEIAQHIPIPTFYGDERYLTSSILIAKNGKTSQNMSFHRMMYLGKNRFSVRITPRHLYEIYNHEENDLEVAVIMGVHPAVEIAAATSYTPDFDELKFASSLLDGIAVVEMGDLLVPVETEIVMHGRLTKDVALEGPFVDLTGTMDIQRSQPIFECDELYYRNDPLFRVIVPGGIEHGMLMGISQEPRIYRMISNTVPSVKNVRLTEGGCCWLHGVASIKKRKEGDGKNTILAALAAHPSMKRIIVVDDDIDIFDDRDVEWALATRFQSDRDLVVITNARGSSLDPSADLKNHSTSKYGMDATRPMDKEAELFKRVGPPLDLDPEDYL